MAGQQQPKGNDRVRLVALMVLIGDNIDSIAEEVPVIVGGDYLANGGQRA